MDTEIDKLAYRLALAQLPVYRQVLSPQFSIVDSYRIALTLIANDEDRAFYTKSLDSKKLKVKTG